MTKTAAPARTFTVWQKNDYLRSITTEILRDIEDFYNATRAVERAPATRDRNVARENRSLALANARRHLAKYRATETLDDVTLNGRPIRDVFADLCAGKLAPADIVEDPEDEDVLVLVLKDGTFTLENAEPRNSRAR